MDFASTVSSKGARDLERYLEDFSWFQDFPLSPRRKYSRDCFFFKKEEEEEKKSHRSLPSFLIHSPSVKAKPAGLDVTLLGPQNLLLSVLPTLPLPFSQLKD